MLHKARTTVTSSSRIGRRAGVAAGRGWHPGWPGSLCVDRGAAARRVHTLPTLTLAVGLGVSNAVDNLLRAALGSGKRVSSSVKWPNDVWVDRKKIAGVLVEASTVGAETSAVIIGIGLNVNRTHFDDELSMLATSLRLASGRDLAVDREHALSILLAHVERAVDRWSSDGPESIVPEVEARLALRGERVTHDGAAATLLGIASSGAIRLETAEGALVERVSGRLLPA